MDVPGSSGGVVTPLAEVRGGIDVVATTDDGGYWRGGFWWRLGGTAVHGSQQLNTSAFRSGCMSSHFSVSLHCQSCKSWVARLSETHDVHVVCVPPRFYLLSLGTWFQLLFSICKLLRALGECLRQCFFISSSACCCCAKVDVIDARDNSMRSTQWKDSPSSCKQLIGQRNVPVF